MPITFIEKLAPAGNFSICDANNVGGHRSVAFATDLYSLSDAIISASKTNTNNDAIGQVWCVTNDGTKNGYYKLVNWTNRANVAGWLRVDFLPSNTTFIGNNYFNNVNLNNVFLSSQDKEDYDEDDTASDVKQFFLDFTSPGYESVIESNVKIGHHADIGRNVIIGKDVAIADNFTTDGESIEIQSGTIAITEDSFDVYNNISGNRLSIPDNFTTNVSILRVPESEYNRLKDSNKLDPNTLYIVVEDTTAQNI